MVKIESILGEAYGLRIKKSKKLKHHCYIGEILNEKCLEAIGAHSISRSNNLDNHTWYSFQHDSDNPNNKYLMLDQKVLKSISEYSASVTHTICLKHDSQFHIFEGNNNIEINNPYQLNLLNIRTFINFYFKALNSKKELLLRKKFLEEKIVNFTHQQDIKKLKLAIRNIKKKIKENEILIKQKSFLEYLVNQYWDFIHKNEEIAEGFYNTNFLTEEMNFLVIPLKNKPSIVGSFLIHSKILKKHLMSSNEQLEELIGSEINYYEEDCYEQAEHFDYEYYDEEKAKVLERMESYAEDSGFIVFHILKNENKPCIISQSYDNNETRNCLVKLFMELRDEPIKMIDFITSIAVRNSNVFYCSELIKNLTDKEINQLTKFYNKKKSFPSKLINKLSQEFKTNNEEIILYLKGKSYKYVRAIEKKASVKILSINFVDDIYSDYLSLHYLLGNNDYHNDKVEIYNDSGSIGRGYEENQTIFLILNEYENYISQIENEESDGNIEYSDEIWEKRLTQKKKKIFNSNLGHIYYDFFEKLPDFINSFCKKNPNQYSLKDFKEFVQKKCSTNRIYVDIL